MPFGLALGLTNPPRTSLPEESLGFRGIGFSPMFSLLKPTFSLLLRPYPLSLVLQSKTERSPTDIKQSSIELYNIPQYRQIT